MQFNIQPLEIVQTAVKLMFKIINTTDTEATIYYELIKEDGKIAETGNKTVPITALQILGQSPVNIPALNAVLAGFNVTATDQILPNNN